MKLCTILLACTAFVPLAARAQVVTSGLQPATSVNDGDQLVIDQGTCDTCTHKTSVLQLLASPRATAAQAAQSAFAALNTANTTAANLTAEIARALAAELTKPTLGPDGTLSAQTVKPTGSSSTHTLADTAAAALNSAQLNTSNCVIVPTTTWTVCPSGGNAVTLSIAGVPQATYGLDASSHPYQRMGSN